MKLSLALKKKKKLVADIAKTTAKLRKYNSNKMGYKPPFDPEEAYNKLKELTQQLITLKCQIQLTNQPIYGKIFELAECKAMISVFQGLSTIEGMHEVGGGYGQPTKEVEFTVFIGEIKREELVEELETKIDTIQSEIEAFNSTTELLEVK